jgi:hypothetical protein
MLQLRWRYAAWLGCSVRKAIPGRFGCGEEVQIDSFVSEALRAFSASFVGYLGAVLLSRMALFDPKSIPPSVLTK